MRTVRGEMVGRRGGGGMGAFGGGVAGLLLAACSLAFPTEDRDYASDEGRGGAGGVPMGGAGGSDAGGVGAGGAGAGPGAGGAGAGGAGAGGAGGAGGTGGAGAAGGTPRYVDAVLADRPVAYYRFGEPAGSTSVTSAVGGAPDGACKGDLSLGAPGLIANDGDGAVRFERGAISFGDSFNFIANDAFSLEVWLLADLIEAEAFRRVFSKEAFGTMPGQSIGFHLQVNEQFTTFNRESLIGGAAPTSVGLIASAGDETLPVGRTHHVVVTSDGTVYRFFLNGVLRREATGTADLPAVAAPFFVGNNAKALNTADSFVGVIDDLSIYDRALSLADIERHFRLGTGQPP